MPTLVGTPTHQYQASSSTNTFSYTVPATGARRAIRVFVAAFNGGGGSISGVTYAGVSMTKVGSTFGTITTDGIAEQYILVNPTTGANNVVITASVSVSELIGVASSWEDVDQTTPTSGPAGATGSSSTPSVSLTVTGSDVGCAGVEFFSANADNPAQSDTLLAEQAATSTQTGYSDQYGDGTLSWTLANVSAYAACGFTLVHDGGGADTTPPTLTSPTGTSTGATTAQGTVSTDEGNGTMYAVVSTSATPPSVAQIQAGNDSTGSAGAWSGNQAISSTGVKTFNATGLAGTAYYFYFQHRDAATNDSTVVSSRQFAPYITAWIRA